jgi:DNA-binding MurR/RpiR family transcriptional regulator
VYRDQIRTIYEYLSPGYRRIADFLLTHYQDAAFMTAAEVAKAATVDTALVVRFAQRLGYPGYPELINDIQDDVKRDLRAVYEPPEGDDSPGQILRRNLMQDRNTLEYMRLHLDLEMVEIVVNAILHASRLFVAGEGSAGYMAEGFALQLLILGLPAHAISGELAGPAAKKGAIQPGDVFLGLGLTAMTPGVSAMLKMARAAKAKTVAIVGSLAYPLAAVAEHVLVAPVQTTDNMPSWTGLAGMLNGLAQTIAIGKGERAADGMLDSDQYLNAYAEMLRQQLSSRREIAKAHALKE